MKKLIAVFLSVLLVLGCVVTASADAMAGGWNFPEDHTMTEDAQKAFEKAMEGFAGVGYTPVALLATQVVAGTNYCLLVRGTTVTAAPTSFYALMYIYAGFDGTAQILAIRNLNVAGEAGLAGGKTLQEETGDDAAAAFAKAMEGFAGVGYDPITLLATQVVAGMNYDFLCKGAPVVPNAEPFYAIVTVYAALDGTARVTDVQRLTISVTDPAEELAGIYDDTVSGRAYMELTAEYGAVYAVITWGDGADAYTEWTFSGVPEGDTVYYTDCVQTDYTVDEKGNETATVVYTDGTGTLTVAEDGSVTWQDAQYENSANCVFVLSLG